tara:strand:+ start:25779 stop:26447 length:669 start_codon:yes stop_codon:yes gene_type:complete
MKNFVLKFLVTVIFCSYFGTSSFTQKLSQERKIDSLSVITQLDSLKKNFETNKEIPIRYELVVYKAISYFPELIGVKMKFKVQKIKTTLNTRPSVASIFFRRKSKRTYIVRIDESNSSNKVTLRDASFNARVGVFGHEFNHIVDYSKRSFIGVVARAFAYSSKKSKEKFEKEIDKLTIDKGLGWQLYDWSFYVLNKSKGTEKYKKFKRLIYLEPCEINDFLF